METLDLAQIPEHMREEAEYYGHFAPEYYEESECANCGRPVYRYKMDVIIEWKHFNGVNYCSTLRATPKDPT